MADDDSSRMALVAQLVERCGGKVEVLALDVGVDQSTVWRWLHGRTKPHRRHLQKLEELARVRLPPGLAVARAFYQRARSEEK